DHNIPPDPEEFPSRTEALRFLGERLGQEIALDVESQIAQGHERFYREALSRIAAHSFDLAAENLVVFLYGRRGHEDSMFESAVRELKALTKCDLPQHWKK